MLLGLLLWASRPFVVEADLAEDIGLGQMRGQIGERVCELGVCGLGDPCWMQAQPGQHLVWILLLEREHRAHGIGTFADGDDLLHPGLGGCREHGVGIGELVEMTVAIDEHLDQPCGLVATEHQIEALHGIARRSFAEVVEPPDQNQSLLWVAPDR